MAQDFIKIKDQAGNILTLGTDGSIVSSVPSVDSSGFRATGNGINFSNNEVIGFPPSGERYIVDIIVISASGACTIDLSDTDSTTILPAIYLAANGGAVLPIPPNYKFDVELDKGINITTDPSGTPISYLVAGHYQTG